MSVTVRNTVPGDVDRLTDIEARAFGDLSWGRAAFRAFIAQTDVKAMTATGPDAHAIGFCLWRVAADEAEILHLGVDPDHQRCGAAKALLNTLESAARTQGAVSLFLEVSAANSAARALYNEAGFHLIGERRGYYRNGEDAIMMAKDIQAIDFSSQSPL